MKTDCGGDPEQGTDRNWKRLYSRECPENTRQAQKGGLRA